MPTLTLSHFAALTLFALFSSVIFGITLREEVKEQIRYGLFCFVCFLGGAIVAGWAMFLVNRR